MPSQNPSFSKAGRFNKSSKAATPGPGQYQTAGQMGAGKSKSYTMRQKTNAWGKESSVPGPGRYNLATSIGKGMSKSMSMGNIRGNLRTGSAVPGPGAYNAIRLEKSTVRSPPSYSMRPRTSYMKNSQNTPGPGTYTIDNTVGKGMKKSMSYRTLTKTRTSGPPGPGTYQPVLSGSRSAPAFTLRPRTNNMNSQEGSPGPGTYKLGTYIGRSTSKSMHQRHKTATSVASMTPGPGTYQDSKWFGSKGLATSMKGTRKAGKDDSTPGPAAYTAEQRSTKKTAPSYTMRKRTGIKSSSRNTPGPIYNIKGTMGQTGNPSYTMRPRTTKFSSAKGTPGPDTYSPSIVKGVQQPSYSMRQRTKSTKHSGTPGPKYDPRRIKYAPSYTMVGRNAYF